MRYYFIIALICVFATQCTAKTASPATDTANQDTVEVVNDTDTTFTAEADTFDINTLPHLADIPKLTKGIVIANPSEAALQKPVKTYPEFKDGDEYIKEWLCNHLQYPREAFERTARGSSHLCIHITSKGTVDSISVLDANKYTLVDTIAWGLVCQMPQWKPATDINGQPTDFWYYLGVRIDHQVLIDRAQKAWEKYLEENPGILIETAYIKYPPEFPGGEEALYDWIAEQITYTPEMEGLSGRVTTVFDVDRQGFIDNVKVVRGKHSLLDAQALEIVKSFPRWRPAYDDCDSKRCTYILPITFKGATM